MKEIPEFIPMAMLNAFAFCPRRFYYEFTLGEMVVNEFVLEGQQLHQRVDQPGQTMREERMQLRRVYLCAPKLGLIGYCDLVELAISQSEEVTDLAELARSGQLYPVEYKKGKLGRWLSDHVQLCAQALALEESLTIEAGSISKGYLFYYGSARREEVLLDAALRDKTLTLLGEARQVAIGVQPPLPISNRNKCRDCSLEPICLPREVLTFESRKKKGVLANDGNSLPE